MPDKVVGCKVWNNRSHNVYEGVRGRQYVIKNNHRKTVSKDKFVVRPHKAKKGEVATARARTKRIGMVQAARARIREKAQVPVPDEY